MSAQMSPGHWLIDDFQLHPALAVSHALDFSIDRGLFDAVFKDERFTEWQSQSNTWQLRFTGSPGCGKTTLSSVVVENLRNQRGNNDVAIAGIYLQQDVTSYEGVFAEDFLRCIFSQLSSSIVSSDPGDAYRVEYNKYLDACKLQQRCSFRTKLIRSALRALVPKLQRSFVLVDDIDRCSAATLLFAEEELSYLQGQGVKIMTTSRIPWVDEPWVPTQCSGKECLDEQPGRMIHVYWACEDCCKDPDDEEGITVFCNACWRQKPGCQRCDNYTRFSQPYEHVDFSISRTSDAQIAKIVRGAIEEEHGDVGLNDTHADNRMLTSAFGLHLKRSGRAEEIVADIVQRAQGNIALAHKRLELLHREQSLEAILATHDRLPASIVEMFDASLGRVEAQAANERLLGLQAIAVAGRYDNGVSFNEFQQLTMANSETGRIDRRYIKYRSLDDVLHAARGFVIRVYHPKRGPVLRAFHADFYLYSREHYHPSILWANNSLKKNPEGQSGLRRAQTFSPGEAQEKRSVRASQKGRKLLNARKATTRRAPQELPALKEEEEEDNEGNGFVADSGFSVHRRATFQAL